MVAEPIYMFEELAQFLASLSPTKVLNFKSSKKSQGRVNYLLEKNAETGLTSEEQDEMEKYMMVEHIIQLAKAKALIKLTHR